MASTTSAPLRCSVHKPYRGCAEPARDCPTCVAIYESRHPVCLCGCGGRVKLADRRATAKYATRECRSRHLGVATASTTARESLVVRGDVAELTQAVNTRITTLAQLIRVCQIDTKEWEVERYVCNKWEMGFYDKTRKRADQIPLFQVKAWLRRRSATSKRDDSLRAELLADIRKAAKQRVWAKPPRRSLDPGWLFEFSPVDLHMGKYAWAEETVANYDVDIAEDLFNASLDYLLAQALKLADQKLARVLCVFGSDVSHLDSKRGETTSGTRMDVDTRYVRIYRRICSVHRRAVDLLSQVAPVDVVVVPGNHDELTSFHLGEILAAMYESAKHITVDNRASLRKYYEYGVNLFGFTHGDAERVSELPLLMARERPDAWARCPSREWHIGHKHIAEKYEARGRLEQDLHSDKGVRIRRLSSLSAHDAWHIKHGYMDRRSCDGFLFHKRAGFTSHLSFNVDHFSGKAVSK